MLGKLKEIYLYREVLANFVSQELKVKYKRSFLGFLWSLLNPILTMAVSSVVFAHIMRFELKDFVVFIYSGLLPWGFISLSIEGSTMSLLNAESFIKKIYLPKALFPLSGVMSNFVNMFFSMVALFFLLTFIGAKFSWALIFLPISFLLVFILTAGISFMLSLITVYFRDIKHIVGVLTSALFYLTPILYPPEYIPAKYSLLLKLNPFYYFVELFRAPIYYCRFPDYSIIGMCVFLALTVFLVASIIFFKYEKEIVFRL